MNMKTQPDDEQECRQIVEQFVTRVRHALGPVVIAVYWFGSRARGTGENDADFDLLVETTSALSSSQRDGILDISIDIAAEYGCLLDVHYYTSEELRSPPCSRTPFIMNVLEESTVL